MDTKLLLSSKTPCYSLLSYDHSCHRTFMSKRTTMSLRRPQDVPKTVYRDSWLDLMAINHLSHNLQAVSGVEVEKDGYGGLVEACKAVTLKYSQVQQHQIVLDCLERCIPTRVFALMTALVPNTKFVRETLATFTGLLFVWLIGPSQVKNSNVDGQKEKNVVYIKKCRFLESSNCVGMCTNLCKFPSQKFIKDTLGVPITMLPNFEDMSCEMIFGEEPPSTENDPITKQPCYNHCKIKKKHSECGI
ncbi:hypothetical protein vseg_014001 [Gypsophila vaccaria]